LPLPADASVLGVGVDVVGIARMRTALSRTPGLGPRVFSSRERLAADEQPDAAARYASSFAVKEAVVKSLGIGLSDVTLRDIELVDRDHGPELVVGGHAGSVAESRGVVGWFHRIESTDRRVVAVVVPHG
jgi:holo-[acyl-carrier protein] synthase